MSTAQEYVEAIFRRARVPLEPADFHPDWADQPFRHKAYADAGRLPLPPGQPEPRAEDGQARFGLPSLAGMLRHSYGLLSRRLQVNGNQDNADRSWYRTATWGRGTASGGGLYPAEIYWACGPSGPVQPGLYHYSTPHHAMQRLLAGDVTRQVRGALGDSREAAETDQFLLVTVKFWKNSFKYNSFCYHVVTMDVGALLGTWQAWAAEMGVRLRNALWFDEPALDRLLGIDYRDESVLAVVPLPWAPGPAGHDRDAGQAIAGSPYVAKAEIERSRTTLRFEMVEKVHESTIVGKATRPGFRLAEPAAAPASPRPEPVPLPPPQAAGMTLGDALRARHSSFGAFTAQPPLSLGQLGTLLAAGQAGQLLNTDVREAGQGPSLGRLAVFANHVECLPRGAYDYDAAAHALSRIAGDPPSPFLQWQYFLNNYNLEQAAAVITVVVRPAAVVSAVGDRGYRLVNAEVGAVAEAVYLAAAGAGASCGAALGFDNVSLAERLGLNATGEWPALLLLVGNDRADRADFEDRLVPNGTPR